MHYVPVASPNPPTTAIFRNFKKSTAPCKVHNMGPVHKNSRIRIQDPDTKPLVRAVWRIRGVYPWIPDPDPQHWLKGKMLWIRNTGYYIVIDFNPFRECTTTLRDCVPLLMNYDVLRSQFEWLINGDSIETDVQDNLGTQLTVLEKFLR